MHPINCERMILNVEYYVKCCKKNVLLNMNRLGGVNCKLLMGSLQAFAITDL